MSTRLENDPNMRTTDHGDEIATLRHELALIMDTKRGVWQFNGAHPSVSVGTRSVPTLVAGTLIQTAMTLLETHDATGISLDDWTGPREMVLLALNLVGYPDEALLENGV